MTATIEPAIAAGSLVHVDPGTLLLERNIREATLDPQFVASVKDVGVLEPIVAVTNDTGGLVVRFGHRRTLAAVEAGRDTVPVYVAGSDDLATSAEVDRIIRQHDENTQRRPLTAGEQVGVVEQLAAFGISANQISKRARVPRGQVDAALTVAQSELASKAAAKYEALTLEQAAVVAEFEDDPETAKALVVAAVDQPEQFAHVAQQQRDLRAERLAKAAVRTELEAAGVKVIDAPSWDSKVKRLDYLKVSAGGAKLTKVNHAKCPGHVAWVTFAGWGGKRNDERQYGPEYGCSDPKKHGHFNTMASTSTSSQPKADDLTPEQREKNREARALVVGNNKAWVSAETVRRAWLAEFAQQKAAPKGAAVFIARAIEQNAGALSEYDSRALAYEWLGIKRTGSYRSDDIAAAAEKASEGRRLQMVLVTVLAAYERQLTRDAWREDGKTSNAGHYLRYLESIGYGLSDVEKFAISSKKA